MNDVTLRDTFRVETHETFRVEIHDTFRVEIHDTFRVEIHDVLPSTSDYCIEAARTGAVENLAVLAHRQTAARGSRGRGWSTGAGNLALSILLRPGTRAAEVGQWALLAGVAVIEALRAYVDDPARLMLKWPNDVLLDGAKLAGILVESETMPDGGVAWLVIGIGVNLASAPALADRATVALPAPIAPETAAAAILLQLGTWRTRLERHGFGPIRQAWLGRAHPVGTAIPLGDPAVLQDGRFAGLTLSGALVVATGSGERIVTSA